MTLKPGQQIIAMHILNNTSGIKGNHQAMKFCSVIEYNMTSIFLGNSCRKCGGETIPIPFSEKSKLNVPLYQ